MMQNARSVSALARENKRELGYLALLLILPFSFFLIGAPMPILEKDAGQYHDYATHLVESKGFSLDGATFSNFREPVYPFFIAFFYLLFGVGNTLAVVIAQTILLGLLGYLVYRIFVLYDNRTVGYGAGVLTILIPYYGLYTHIYGTELLFTLELAALFFVCASILRSEHPTRQEYLLLGFLAAIGTLTRVQLLLFLPFLLLVALLIKRFRTQAYFKGAALSLGVFLLLVGAWAGYVHSQNGTYAITMGRPDVALYARAVHARLSYAELTHYYVAWFRRSATGGEGDAALDDGPLGVGWGKMATTTAATLAIRAWSIDVIKHRFGHYLYDSVGQTLRLLYIEHDYSDFLNRYVRAGVYIFLYGLFFFRLITLWRTRKKHPRLFSLAVLAILFILYNILIIIPLFAIPRYNTPYLWAYLAVGFLGYATRSHRELSTDHNEREPDVYMS